MARSKYSRGLKIKVAKEAMLPENQGLEHVIAEKYHVMPWTVIKWRDIFSRSGKKMHSRRDTLLKNVPLQERSNWKKKMHSCGRK